METPMIRFQIIEKPGANLYKTLVRAMRDGDLRTLRLYRSQGGTETDDAPRYVCVSPRPPQVRRWPL